MNRAKSILPEASAEALKTEKKSCDDDPIYKGKRMYTVTRMRKRIFILPAGMLLGIGAAHFGFIWNLFPGRELTRSADYVRDVMRTVNDNYFDPKEASFEQLTRNAIHGMVETLDPHSEYLESKDNAELEEDLDGEFGGVGVEVDVREGRIVVIAPIPGTPGDRAGIQRGDEITEIDGHSVEKTVTMGQIVDRLRGKPHTRVAMSLFRPATHTHFSVTLVREIIKVESVTGVRVLDGAVGYLQLTEFSEHTGEQFDAALEKLLKQNITALIIDLRNNPGGLLDAAVDVAEPFFRKGELIVYTQGRKASDREEFRSENDGEPMNLPVAILINSETASAAEIVTGALKDTGRAVIVGERSFGKGSVQSLFKLKDGEGLRLTTGRYFTPSGVSIHAQGIAPQIEIVMTAAEDDKLRQQNARPDITNPQAFKARFGFDPIEDAPLRAARDVLAGINLFDSQVGPIGISRVNFHAAPAAPHSGEALAERRFSGTPHPASG